MVIAGGSWRRAFKSLVLKVGGGAVVPSLPEEFEQQMLGTEELSAQGSRSQKAIIRTRACVPSCDLTGLCVAMSGKTDPQTLQALQALQVPQVPQALQALQAPQAPQAPRILPPSPYLPYLVSTLAGALGALILPRRQKHIYITRPNPD
jgi:hypothetical protein